MDLSRRLPHIAKPNTKITGADFNLFISSWQTTLQSLARNVLTRPGKPFDPHLHQAMDRTETAEHEDGTVLQVFQPGYVFHGRVLRPAMVRVAVQPAGASKAIRISAKKPTCTITINPKRKQNEWPSRTNVIFMKCSA